MDTENWAKEYRFRVEKGVELLDDYFGGRHWTSRIDYVRLELADPFECILGHLFSGYINGMSTLEEFLSKKRGAFTMWGSEFGFSADGYTNFDSNALLKDAWLEVLDKRQ